MKNLNIYKNLLIILALSMISLPSYAGKIYRFLDKDGVSTTSKRLPPNAAQQGYDILDDKSLRLIERVPTQAELMAEKEAERILLQAKLDEQEEKEQEEKRRKTQSIIDQNLLDRYPSSEDIIKARDAEHSYVEKQIADTVVQKKYNVDKLHRLQQDAAELELAGQAISGNLTQRIQAIQEEINNNQLHIDKLKSDEIINKKQFEDDLIRLRELQGIEPQDVEITSTLNNAQD